MSAKVGKREEEAGGENDESDGNVVSESVDINGGASVFPEQLTASEAGGGVVDGDRSDTLQCAVSDQKDGKRISLVASDGSNDVQMKVDDTNELHSSKSSKKTKRLSKTLANRTETQVLDRNLTDTQEMVAMVAIAIGGDNSNGLAEDDVHGSLEMRRPGLRVKRAKTYVKEKVMCEELEEEKRAREDEAAAVAASLEEEKSRIRKLAKKRQVRGTHTCTVVKISDVSVGCYVWYPRCLSLSASLCACGYGAESSFNMTASNTFIKRCTLIDAFLATAESTDKI